MENRKYKRIQIHSDIFGKMVLTSQIRIIDLSMTGVRFSCLRRVGMNSNYKISFTKGELSVELKGTVVRSMLKNAIVEGQPMPIYEVAMNFDDLSAEQDSSLQALISLLEND